MPIQMGDKTFKDMAEAVRYVRKTKPEVKDPVAYVATVERTIQERRAKKAADEAKRNRP